MIAQAVSPIKDPNGRIIAAAIIARDVTERRHYEERLRYLADYDQHPADTATETFEEELDETTDMMLAAEAEQVELALQRLADGTYGQCVECGKEIPPEIQGGKRLSTMTGNQKAKPVLSEITTFAQHGQSRAWVSDFETLAAAAPRPERTRLP